jgi:hypothetical protein
MIAYLTVFVAADMLLFAVGVHHSIAVGLSLAIAYVVLKAQS